MLKPEILTASIENNLQENGGLSKDLTLILTSVLGLELGLSKNPDTALSSAFDTINVASLPEETKADLLVHVGGLFGLMTDPDSALTLDEQIRKKYLPSIFGPHKYQQMSQEIGQVLHAAQVIPKGYFGELTGIEEGPSDNLNVLNQETLETELPTFSSLSPAVRGKVLERLVGLKLIVDGKDGYEFPKRKKSQKYLLSGALELVEGWQQVKERLVDGSDIKTLGDYTKTLKEHNEKRAISKLVFEDWQRGLLDCPNQRS